jgi:L-lactate dehydrogenase complex protein LldE
LASLTARCANCDRAAAGIQMSGIQIDTFRQLPYILGQTNKTSHTKSARGQPARRWTGIRMKVALFVPCFIDAFYPEVGIATLELLERSGRGS